MVWAVSTYRYLTIYFSFLSHKRQGVNLLKRYKSIAVGTQLKKRKTKSQASNKKATTTHKHIKGVTFCLYCTFNLFTF